MMEITKNSSFRGVPWFSPVRHLALGSFAVAHEPKLQQLDPSFEEAISPDEQDGQQSGQQSGHQGQSGHGQSSQQSVAELSAVKAASSLTAAEDDTGAEYPESPA
jgi:hypothetical protein